MVEYFYQCFYSANQRLERKIADLEATIQKN